MKLMSPSPVRDHSGGDAVNSSPDCMAHLEDDIPGHAVDQFPTDSDGSSDESDADGSHGVAGYQLLPSEYQSDVQPLYSISPTLTNHVQVNGQNVNNSSMQEESVTINHAFSQEQRKDRTKPLDAERVNQILDIMKNVQLPAANIPSWVGSVSEEEWKTELSSLALNKRAAHSVEHLEHRDSASAS